jgi:hypothetical protein
MIETKKPDPRIVDQATGQPTQGFIGRASDIFECRVQFFGDKPNGGCNYQWDAEPNHCVEWVGTTWEWKRTFRVIEDGRLFVTLTDSNGFTYDVPSVYVHAMKPVTESLSDV